jgi:hypothetical protein
VKLSERRFEAALATGAAAIACFRASQPVAFTDYPTDAGPSLSALAHGHLAGFFSHQPAMGPASLILRAPFVLAAAALGDGTNGLYRWGCAGCLLLLAAAAVWLARMANRGGIGRPGRVLIVAVCLINPLVGDALFWGHPEEIATSALVLFSLLAALEGRGTLAAVCLGLAIASKQWAVVALLPALLLLPRERWRAGLSALGVAGAGYLTMFLANPSAFRAALSYISHPQPVVTMFNWLFPVSHVARITVANMFGAARTYPAHYLPADVLGVTRPAITVIGILIPVWIVHRHGWRPRPEVVLSGLALALLVRCTLDAGTGAYYHLPLLVVLLGLDVLRRHRYPIYGLLGAAVSYFLIHSALPYFSLRLTNATYLVVTLPLAVVLVREISGVASRSAVAAQPVTIASTT